MNECIIREAVLADAAAIARLVTQLGYPASATAMEERLRMLHSRSEYITFVTEVSPVVVGMVGAYLGYAFEFSGAYGRLTGLAVDEKWRGRGIGKMLMDSVERWLKMKFKMGLWEFPWERACFMSG